MVCYTGVICANMGLETYRQIETKTVLRMINQDRELEG